jgi:NAD(P)-dependent dehydrogenase (short-subunit alcohol dehydrogenase family)
MKVVDLLEVIEVDEHDGQDPTESLGAREFDLERALALPPVREPREGVGERLLTAGYTISAGVRDPAKVPFSGERVLACRYDAKDRAAVPAWVAATVKRFGRIDGLVNAAGINPLVRVIDEDEAPLDEMWEVNVKAPLRMVRAALPYLEASGTGRVINIASMSGKRIWRQDLPEAARCSSSLLMWSSFLRTVPSGLPR